MYFSISAILTITIVATMAPRNIDFALVPNPTTGKFRIITSNEGIEDILIYNALGVKVFSSPNYQQEIDLSGFSKGSYFVVVHHDWGVWRSILLHL